MAETKIPVGGLLPSGSQQLLVWRDLTRRTGMLHEVQALNLRVWPRGFLNTRTSVAKYDHANLKVTFEIGDFEDRRPRDLGRRLRYLDAAVKYLLGTDVAVVVQQGERTLYEGAPTDEKTWLALTSRQQNKKSTTTG